MLFNGKLCEWRSVPRQDFLSAAFKCASGVSRSVQHAVSHAKTCAVSDLVFTSCTQPCPSDLSAHTSGV